jgi:serine/threonine-protein kinase
VVDPAVTASGHPLLGDFVVLGVLGEGGSGIVYDARWGHREVALKVLHPTLAATPKEREQFLIEARRLAEIHHAGVVKVLAVGQVADGRPYLAMEKLHGETLAARIARGPLPVEQALELFGQLTDAVDALHARGLIHRDLKPENVMLVAGVDGRQHAVLLDFGIAKELASAPSTTTQDGGIRGTPAYMAPERFFGQSASVVTDVYELAVTLFAMLSGRLPWDEVADPEVRLDPKRLGELAPHLPPALDVEVRRALSTRAQNRPASARELRAAVLTAAGVNLAVRSTVPVRASSVPPVVSDLGTAPTVSTRQSSAPRRTGRVIAAVIGVAAVATGVGVAAHVLTEPTSEITETQPQSVVATATATAPATSPVKTPTAPEPQPEAPEPLAATGPSVQPLATGKSDLVARLVHLPDDEMFAFGAQVGELDGDTDLRPLIDLFADSQPGIMLRAETNLNACALDLRKVTDWIVFAGPAEGDAVDLLAAGRWSRAEIEACIVKAVAGDKLEAITDKVSAVDGPRGRRLVGWIDDTTFLVTSRDVDPAWMTERLADTAPPAGALGAAIGEIDPSATIWVAGDESTSSRASLTKGTEMSGLWGTLDADPAMVSLDMWIRYPTPDQATLAAKELESSLGGMMMDPTMGHIKVDTDAARAEVLHVDMAMSRMLASMLIMGVAEKKAGP